MPKVTYTETAPAPEEIAAAIKRAGHTRAEFARAVHCALRTAEDWLAGRSPMHPGLWELYQLKTRTVHKLDEISAPKRPFLAPQRPVLGIVDDLNDGTNIETKKVRNHYETALSLCDKKKKPPGSKISKRKSDHA